MHTFTSVVLAALLFTSSTAEARSVKWFSKGATVEAPGTIEVPLYRGDHADFRPLVRVEAQGVERSRTELAVVDLAHGWSKISWRMATSLGLIPEETTLQGRYAQVVVLPELRVGEIVLHDVRAEVSSDPLFVLGLSTIPGLATAIVPSAGVVRFSMEGEALVEANGAPVPIRQQSAGKWKAGDRKVYGNGLSYSVEGAMSGRDGWMQLRTDEAASLVTMAYEDPRQRRRGGEVHVRARGRVGEVELAESWAVRDESLSDKADDFVGALGYDQLYSVDVAISPADGIVSMKPAFKPQWSRAEQVRLELAKAAHKAGGLAAEDQRSDRPPRMGFDSTDATSAGPGDPGDPKVLRLETQLAAALWEVGSLDRSIRHYLRAAEAAGDRCGPHMELGLKRLHWSGSMQQQDFIVELIRQPLRQAGDLYDRWASVDAKTREAVRKGKSVSEEVFQIEQEARCLTAWGTLMAAYVAQGDTEASSKIYRDHYGKDPLVAYAQGLSLLEQKQPKTAEIPIREALSFNVHEKGDIKLGLGRAQVDQGLKEPVHQLLKEVPGLELDHGLAAAMIVLEWGTMLDGEEGAAEMASRLVTADPYWIPAQLVAAWKQVEEADPTQLQAELIRQRGRSAGSMDIEVYHAVLTAIQGDGAEARRALRTLQKSRPPTPDLFAALALVASLNGRLDRVQDNLTELRLRYPTLPFNTLDLPLPEPEAVDEEERPR